jgi:hypothetical protein
MLPIRSMAHLPGTSSKVTSSLRLQTIEYVRRLRLLRPSQRASRSCHTKRIHTPRLVADQVVSVVVLHAHLHCMTLLGLKLQNCRADVERQRCLNSQGQRQLRNVAQLYLFLTGFCGMLWVVEVLKVCSSRIEVDCWCGNVADGHKVEDRPLGLGLHKVQP